jgi:hypothetical protein
MTDWDDSPERDLYSRLHSRLERIFPAPGQVLPVLRWAGQDRWTVEAQGQVITGMDFEAAVICVEAWSSGAG